MSLMTEKLKEKMLKAHSNEITRKERLNFNFLKELILNNDPKSLKRRATIRPTKNKSDSLYK